MARILSSIVSYTVAVLSAIALTGWILERSGVALGAVAAEELQAMVQAIVARGIDPCSADFFVELNAACGEEADYCEAVGDSDEHSWDALATWADTVAPSFAPKAPASAVLYSLFAIQHKARV